jgi:general stress protein 26
MTEISKHELKEKILAKFTGPTLSSLATITEDGKPWMRYVISQMDENLNLWVAAFINSRKVAQIHKNPEVHLTAGVNSIETAESYVHIQGRTEILTDEETKNKVWYEHLQDIFSGPNDQNYSVLKITPYRIELQEEAPVSPKVWEP